MSKLKTHSGCKKRFRSTAGGKILRGFAKKRHNLRKVPMSMKRNARGMTVMDECDARVIRRHFAPYGLR